MIEARWTKPKAIQVIGILLLVLCMGKDVMGAASTSSRYPNIIIILADDMGYGDVHAFHPESEVPTPNLDTLAREGMVFTDAHTPSAICTPTRYGLLTGRYCWRTRLKSGVLKGYDLPLIEEERVTLADYLDDLGYQTGVVGKWHLGLEYRKKAPGVDGMHGEYDLTRPLLHTPNNDGFDYSFVLPASLDFEPYLYVRNYDIVDTDFVRVPTTAYPHFWREGIKSDSLEFDQVLDDLLGEAKAFIRRAAGSDDPFFLYFPLTAPHKPVSPAERFVGESGRGLYGDFVHQIDWTAGEIMKLLEELELAENTLVIFTSDNGSPMYSMNAATFPDHVTDETLAYYNERHHRANGYLRGIKGDLYEGGHRVPFIVRWPAEIQRDQRTDETICLTDVFETMVELTGGKTPEGSAEDSYSFASQLLGKENRRNRPPMIHHAGGDGMFAIRKDKWKLILGNGSGARTDPKGRPFRKPYQLFNLDHDLSESINLIDQAPGVAKKLEADFRAIQGVDQTFAENRLVLRLPDHAGPERVGRLVAEKLLARDYMIRAARDGIHYAENCAADGALTFAGLIEDEELFSRLEERYACYLEERECSLLPDTDTYRYQAGLVVLSMFSHNKNPLYLAVALDLVRDKWMRWGDPYDESLLFRTARFWADDMYLTPTLDPRIYRLTGDPLCLDRPANWTSEYIDRLQLPNGLFRHTTEVPFVWARGVGWAAVGLTNLLIEMPEDHPKRAKLMGSYLSLMTGLIPYQAQSGLWRQLIDDPDAWEETSGSAMFTYAMATGIRLGWLDSKKFGPILRKGWLGLVAQLDESGRLHEVCVGTNEEMTAQGYLDRRRVPGDLHGQAPMLWTAGALLLLDRERVGYASQQSTDLLTLSNPQPK